MNNFKRIAGVLCPERVLDWMTEINWWKRHSEQPPHPKECVCQGTGCQFPWLWRRCEGCKSEGCPNLGKYYNEQPSIPGCNGTGSVLITDNITDALLRVVSESRLEVLFQDDYEASIYDMDKKNSPIASRYGNTPQEALASALVKALGLNEDAP